jgi:type II secretory pathway pseudopilin PulG
MAALLVAIAVMAVMMSVAMPVWRHEGQREKEAEMVFRGEQYARAVALYQRKFPGAFPPNLDLLVQQKFLRKKYKDPMTEDGEFQVLYAGGQVPGRAQGGAAGAQSGGTGSGSGGGPGGRVSAPVMTPGTGGQGAPAGAGAGGVRGGIIGVTSKSPEASIRLYNGRGRYNEWQFIFSAAMANRPGGGVGMPGVGRPGGIDPRTGRPVGPGGMGPGGMGPGGMGPSGGDTRRPGQGPGPMRPGGGGPGGQPRPPGRPPG